ncbi:MAG: hypothetical protein GY754_08295 [bacterium]|nr:hypothetical protein [bacterium]
MTISQIFLLGIFAGFAVGAPYGPSGTLSLYRSVQFGWRTGLLTAMGSLLAIFIFSFLTAVFINTAIPIIQNRENKEENENKGYLMSFLSAFGVGLISGKNVIGFPTFLIATPYLSETSGTGLLKAFIFSSGTLLLARLLPFMKHMLAVFFTGLGLFLIIRFFM